MLQTRVGEKRARDKSYFIPGLTLSQHPPAQRKDLFMKKLKNIIISKSLHPTEFEGYTIRERFQRMGWEQLLNFSCDKINKRVVIQWMASLSRNGDELTGVVDGRSYTITPVIIRNILLVDTRMDLPYARFNVPNFQAANDENKRRLCEACKTVFGVQENTKMKIEGYKKSKMTPMMQILWGIGVWTFSPRLVKQDDNDIYQHEILVLHALFTGDYLYSFAHLMIDNIWDMYEHEHRRNIPHAYYISEILNRLGAVSSRDEDIQITPPLDRVITRSSFPSLKFSETDTRYAINDRVSLQRVTFTKKGRENQSPPQFTQTPFWQMPPQMHVLAQLVQYLANMQSFQSQMQHSEMMTMLTNIQKQMEEKERQAEIRAHAIIWNMERHRHMYEQEQEQIHKAWNQAYGTTEFQFPQISHNSFHPLRAGSRYYDPAHGDEIPKAFQDFFHDIYGTRR